MREHSREPYGYFDIHQPNVWKAMLKAFLATALFRIWPTLLLLGVWSTTIFCINEFTPATLACEPTLLTVVGTILGLVLSYRTTSAYERYWEGRRLWSQIIINARTMARIIWVHCPDTLIDALPETGWESKEAEEEDRRKAVREKRRAVELCLAFAVAVKHYLRGEEGIFYEDLYPLVKFLPSYNLPSGIPPPDQAYADQNQSVEQLKSRSSSPFRGRERVADTPMSRSPTSTLNKLGCENKSITSTAGFAGMHNVLTASVISSSPQSLRYNQPFSQPKLRPSRCPPKHHWSEAMPIRYLPFAKKERRQRRLKQAMYADSYLMGHSDADSVNGMQTAQNIPLEITMYMSCFIAAVQKRKTCEAVNASALLACVHYAAHIYEVAWLYCIILPFQLYKAFGWIMIPATVITTYILIGLIECGQEIENPFGYDKNVSRQA
ncbi:hypothetical protein NCC49_005445 [Naganishia albida]|nr:hypothetical protein NCC49_005445 [Naganishia albida]